MAMRRESPNARVFANPIEQPTLRDRTNGLRESNRVEQVPTYGPHTYDFGVIPVETFETEKTNAEDFIRRGQMSEDEYLNYLHLSMEPSVSVFPNSGKYNPNKW